MGQFNLENYTEVKDRIAEFIKDFPEGTITTHLRDKDGPEVMFEARVYRSIEEAKHGVYTSGFAREVEGKSPVNKTSHVENCETSAIGRALANLGYSGDANRASRSEMLKVARMNEEHDQMLTYIRSVFGKLTPDTEAVIDGETVKVTEFLTGEKGKTLPDDFRLTRSVVDALEAVTGIKMFAD